MQTSYVEAKVGAFVLVGVALLLGFVLLLSHVRWTPSFTVWADFAYIGTLQPGALVKIAGMTVGEVKQLRLLDAATTPAAAAPVADVGRTAEPLLRAEIHLDMQAQPYWGSAASLAVATQGVIGEAYLDLLPKLLPAAGSTLGRETPRRGVDAPRLDEMTRRLGSLLDSSANLLAALQDVDFKQAWAQFQTTGSDVAALSHSLRLAVGGGQELRATLVATQQTASQLQRRLPILLRQSEHTLATLEQLSSKANARWDNTDFASMLDKTQRTLTALQSSSQQAQSLLLALQHGEGTLGGFLQDPQIYNDMKDLMRDLKQHPWKLLWR